MRLALLNGSSAPADAFVKIAQAMTVMLAELCDVWDLRDIPVEWMPGLTSAPAGFTPLITLQAPTAAGVEGYHDIGADGAPFGQAFLSCVPGGALLHDPSGRGESLSALLMHEAAELAVDPSAGLWQDGPYVDVRGNASHAEVAEEACDPVQSFAYPIKLPDGTLVDASDWVTPAWFRHGSPPGSRFDQMGILSRPLTVAPGGYVIVRDKGPDGQVFARRCDHAIPEAAWRHAAKQHAGSRTARRLDPNPKGEPPWIQAA